MPSPESFDPNNPESHSEEESHIIAEKRGEKALSAAERIELEQEKAKIIERSRERQRSISGLQTLIDGQGEEEEYIIPTSDPEPVEPEPREDLTSEDQSPESKTQPESETTHRAKIEYIKKKVNKNVAFRNFMSGVAVVAVASILGASIPTNGFGLLNKDRARRSVPTESPAIVQTIEDETTTEASGNFEPSGYVTLKNGDRIQCYTYSGGYHSETDPYVTKFDYQNEADYENDDAYGYQIAGDTLAEKTSDWVKNVMLSPEAIVRLRVQMGLEELNSMEQENARANALRTMTPEEYDRIANETKEAFYDKLENGSIESSNDWVLENYMNDEMAGHHENSMVRGRYSGDDESGKERADLLLTFYDADGNNIVSSEQGFLNTKQDAGDNGQVIGQKAWVNMDEGGTWKWKAGNKTPTSTSLETKNSEEEIIHAGPRASAQEQTNSQTSLEQDQESFTAMEQQRSEDGARATEAAKVAAEQAIKEQLAREQAATRTQSTEPEPESQQQADKAAEQATGQAAAKQSEAAQGEREKAQEAAERESAQEKADQAATTSAEEGDANANASAGERTGLDY